MNEEYKPGTWIWVGSNNTHRTKEGAYQLSLKNKQAFNCSWNLDKVLSIRNEPQANSDGSYHVRREFCRLAQPHEIPDTIINNYEIY